MCIFKFYSNIFDRWGDEVQKLLHMLQSKKTLVGLGWTLFECNFLHICNHQRYFISTYSDIKVCSFIYAEILKNWTKDLYHEKTLSMAHTPDQVIKLSNFLGSLGKTKPNHTTSYFPVLLIFWRSVRGREFSLLCVPHKICNCYMWVQRVALSPFKHGYTLKKKICSTIIKQLRIP